MGASNALAAYMLYASRVPPLSMQCLIYMALISKDADRRPWYGQGHAALAEHALGRPEPITDADLRAVRRAVTPLLAACAIEADRLASGRRDGPVTVRYRLNLLADVGRKPSGDAADRRTESDRTVGRKVAVRRTKSGRSQDGNRPPKEEEENEEQVEEEMAGSPTEVQTAREDNAHPEEVIPSREPIGKPRAATCDVCTAYLDPDGSCFSCRRPARRKVS